LVKKLPGTDVPYSVDEIDVVEVGYLGVYTLSRNRITVNCVGDPIVIFVEG